MTNFLEKSEEQELFRQKQSSNTGQIFDTNGSAGNNGTDLARIMSGFDTFIAIMGWQNKNLAKFSTIVTQYQGSVDAKYHNDFKDIQIAEEIERRRAERKGISILQQ